MQNRNDAWDKVKCTSMTEIKYPGMLVYTCDLAPNLSIYDPKSTDKEAL
jgi:hypothetical protein